MAPKNMNANANVVDATVEEVEATVEEKKPDETKKPLNEYQQFVNNMIAELKLSSDEEIAGKKYMELRAIANAEWTKTHPKDPNAKPRIAKSAKVKDTDTDDKENVTATKVKKSIKSKKSASVAPPPINAADSDTDNSDTDKKTKKGKKEKKENKVDSDGNVIVKAKRAPTLYNLFISGALIELKAEFIAKGEKPVQKDLMVLAAAKWREHKESTPNVIA